MKAMFTLTPPESKRLIAKGTVKLDIVEEAQEDGLIIILWGSTTSRVVEELLGKEIEKDRYLAGAITKGVTCSLASELRLPVIVLEKGEPVDTPWKEALKSFSSGDVLIKGANAVDPDGNVGVLMGYRQGGTIGASLPVITSRGASLVVPVGLEKLVPSVTAIDPSLGVDTVDISLGCACGVMPITNALVVTELEALEILADVDAYAVAAGGIGDSQGSVVIAIDGPDDDVKKAVEIVKSVKGEKPLKVKMESHMGCAGNCIYKDLENEDLPDYLL